MTNVAINGFGRIGRLVFRQLMESSDSLDVVAVNDVAPSEDLIYLLKHDSVYGPPRAEIDSNEHVLHWEGKKVQISNISNPDQLPWREMQIDTVVEASGVFTRRSQAAKHLDAGANRVILTAPSKDPDITICMGVNEEQYDPGEHSIISNGSCTTNCLAPVAKVLDEEFGIVNCFLTTVHAYTSSQSIVDAAHKHRRRGRAGAANIVPTSTGATIAVAQTLPQLDGKLDGLAMRVPVQDGSIIDFVCQTERPVRIETVNEAFRRASQAEHMQGILGITYDDLVSSDIVGSTYSALVDAQSTMVLGDHAVKVLAWYDNEWAYARRVTDLVDYTTMEGKLRRAA